MIEPLPLRFFLLVCLLHMDHMTPHVYRCPFVHVASHPRRSCTGLAGMENGEIKECVFILTVPVPRLYKYTTAMDRQVRHYWCLIFHIKGKQYDLHYRQILYFYNNNFMYFIQVAVFPLHQLPSSQFDSSFMWAFTSHKSSLPVSPEGAISQHASLSAWSLLSTYLSHLLTVNITALLGSCCYHEFDSVQRLYFTFFCEYIAFACVCGHLHMTSTGLSFPRGCQSKALTGSTAVVTDAIWRHGQLVSVQWYMLTQWEELLPHTSMHSGLSCLLTHAPSPVPLACCLGVLGCSVPKSRLIFLLSNVLKRILLDSETDNCIRFVLWNPFQNHKPF